MSAPAFRLENNRLHLWTDIARALHSRMIKNEDQINRITLPFHYWSAEHRDHLPEHANVFKYGNYPLDKPNDGLPPDITGRVEVVIQQGDGNNNWERIKAVLLRVRLGLQEREGYHSLLFKTFIPFSTRGGKDTLKSLFPFTGVGRDHLASRGLQNHIGGSLIIGFVMLIMDLATLAFRLLALIPRAIYQRVHTSAPIEGVSMFEGNFDWGKGTLCLHTFHPDYSQDNALRTSPNGTTIYLG